MAVSKQARFFCCSCCSHAGGSLEIWIDGKVSNEGYWNSGVEGKMRWAVNYNHPDAGNKIQIVSNPELEPL